MGLHRDGQLPPGGSLSCILVTFNSEAGWVMLFGSRKNSIHP
jgi:hypothetical protein